MIYLVVGCGGHGAGTGGKRTPPIPSLGGRQIREHEFNQPVFDIMAADLRRHGVIVVDTAPTDYDTPLDVRVAIAKREYDNLVKKHGKANVKACYFSVHYNAYDGKFDGPGKDPEGFSIHIQPGTRNKEPGKLAQAIINEVKAGTPQKNRGIVEQNLKLTREITWMPSALGEFGFMDNKREALLMIDPDFQKEVGTEVAKGILNYFGIKYLPKEDEPMTAAEKAAFDALVNKVATLEAELERATNVIPAPNWFQQEFKDDPVLQMIKGDGKTVPTKPQVFWETLAVSLRAQGRGIGKDYHSS